MPLPFGSIPHALRSCHRPLHTYLDTARYDMAAVLITYGSTVSYARDPAQDPPITAGRCSHTPHAVWRTTLLSAYSWLPSRPIPPYLPPVPATGG